MQIYIAGCTARYCQLKMQFALYQCEVIVTLRFNNLASLNRFSAHPYSLYLPALQSHAYPLQVGSEFTLHRFGYVRTNAATLFRLAFTVNHTSCYRSFPGYNANFRHGSGFE